MFTKTKIYVKSVRDKVLRLNGRAVARATRPNVFDLHSAERVGIVYDNPSEMSTSERLVLFALIRGLRPQTVLEIGSRHGGSASIIASAMMDVNHKENTTIVGVDPGPDITVPASKMFDKFKLVVQPSPEGLAQARAEAGHQFDFALIDGLHIYTQVKADFAGVLPHMKDESYILFHDAFHPGIARAIAEAIEADARLIDCGYICNKAGITPEHPVALGGFRLIRFSSDRIVNAQKLVEADAARRGLAVPAVDPDLADHDPYWYCKNVKRCGYCISHGLNAPT